LKEEGHEMLSKWTLEAITPRTIEINLNYTDPLGLSLSVQDNLLIEVTDPDLLIWDHNNHFVMNDSITFE
jgi:hypothetical protein